MYAVYSRTLKKFTFFLRPSLFDYLDYERRVFSQLLKNLLGLKSEILKKKRVKKASFFSGGLKLLFF